jgi:hypothetical protein
MQLPMKLLGFADLRSLSSKNLGKTWCLLMLGQEVNEQRTTKVAYHPKEK